jgi:hypothetical protein
MWPFSRPKSPAPNNIREDICWLADEPRVRGLLADTARIIASGAHVLLIAHSPERIALLADTAAAMSLPLDGLDTPATAPDLLKRLQSQPGPSVLIALSASLLPSAVPTPTSPTPTTTTTLTSRPSTSISVIITERYPLRDRDDAIIAYAQALSASSIQFHISIKDPLLLAFAGDRTEKTLLMLGMTNGESITHPMLSRSIRRAQAKIAKDCPSPANVESWLAARITG